MSPIAKTVVYWVLALTFAFHYIRASANDDDSLTQAAPYVPQSPLTGEIRIVGSEAMQQLAVLWKRGFLAFHPDVDFRIECQTTNEPVSRLAPSQKVVRLSGHELLNRDESKSDSETGIATRACLVGQEILAAVVHPDNPMMSLKWDPSVQPKILSRGDEIATTWGQLGSSPKSEPIAISLYGPAPSQPKYAFVEELLTSGSGEKPAMIATRSSQEMLAAVGEDLGGIAFHSVARGRPTDVKVLPLTIDGTTLDPFSPEAIEAGYPLVRPVSVVAAVDKSGDFDRLTDQFIRYVLSRDGQLDLIKDGYFPLSQEQLHRQEIELGWEVLK